MDPLSVMAVLAASGASIASLWREWVVSTIRHCSRFHEVTGDIRKDLYASIITDLEDLDDR